MKNRITYKLDNTIQVFRLGKTSNAKIAGPKDKVLQSYTFSLKQLKYIEACVKDSDKPDFKTFFSLDKENCLDCVFSSNVGNNKCYTHKVMQYSGFVSMAKSVINEFKGVENIPTLNLVIELEIQGLAIKADYTRFGAYGEPSLHPIKLVGAIAILSKSYTGYTHQWRMKDQYKDYFMASVESVPMQMLAQQRGWRSFIVTNGKDEIQATICPASKEGGNKATCAMCGLCSGVYGKGTKDVKIIQH